MAAAVRSMRPIGQGQDPTGIVPGDPPMDCLTGNPEVLGDLGNLPAVLKNGHDCLVALIHDADLH
jgi:hypothetical protein